MLTAQQQAVFRPVVRKAWELHCREMHLSPSNKHEYDLWYRDQLASACQIHTTKDAGEREYRILLTRFLLLTGETAPVQVEGFSSKQNSALTALVTSAWETELRRHKIEIDETFDQWVTVHLEQSGIYNRVALDCKETFDHVMANFAVIAHDEYWISRTAAAAEIRMRFVIRGLLDRLSEIEGRVVDWNYCRAIYSHMKLQPTMDDAPASVLWKVLQALDTNVRRLEKQVPKDASNVPF